MPILQSKVEYLLGDPNLEIAVEPPYGIKQCGFLQALSNAIRADAEARNYSDILTFAFWIRPSNILQLKKKYWAERTTCRMGKGIVFHIAPSNVPINFAYTFVYGILSGNSNIIKVSSKKFEQTSIICRIIRQLSDLKEFLWVKQRNAIVVYDKSYKAATDEFSALCDVRVIWGGSQTIEKVRKSVLAPRSVEMTFADRYSFGIVSVDKVLESDEKEIQRLAGDFYNDTFLMDQNACSSPHMIFWVRGG